MSPPPWSLIAKEGTNMRLFPVLLGRGLGIALGVIVTTMAHGQQSNVAPARPEKTPPPAGVHRMVIQQGPNRSVHYIVSGNASNDDRVAAYNLERSENDLSYLRDLQALKQQYVNSERTLEPQRRIVQQQLYGMRTQSGNYGATYYSPGSGFGYVGGYYGYPGGYYPFFNNGWGGGYGYGSYPGGVYGSLGTSWNSTARSLQYGMGNEGVMKNALVQVIAQDASSGHAASAPSREPGFTKGGKVTIWVCNDKYVGTIKDDLPGWVVLQTDKGDVTVRKSEITRSEVPSKP